ncbi:dihydrolipoamide acetyltransferase family protein [Lentibacillus saliphilus]|uniref:dihydrolipoamide acetyltransferase family protein n=1 Tax=Lentibacillus saliphilus TaxID=2737028 RepID=UPI001C2FA9FB|nr:dihydrolipoamide acetyltransferase family protein [Lentibacillus saliphilus]
MLEVKLHDIGEGMTEGEIVHYLVEPGDTVQSDQPLVEVQTDKMVAELPSPAKGTVKEIIVKTGETVKVGTTLMHIEVEGMQSREKMIAHSTQEPTEVALKNPSQSHKQSKRIFNRVRATPHTRRIAREHGIDIEQVTPSDPSGRVSEEDVLNVVNKSAEPEQASKVEVPADGPQTVEASQNETIPFRGIRRQIAKNMTHSLFTIPHVTHFDDIDMTQLFELRETLKQDGVEASVPAFLVKALAFALKDFPIFNAELDEQQEQIILKKSYHFGIATDTDHGLVVPVIRNVNKKSITSIHQEIKSLTARAKTNTLKPHDMHNSTFTVSNVGPLGSTGATPIINYPETALIAFHKTKKMPVVNDHDDIVVRQIMTLSLSFDHRVADGATAVHFTNRLAHLIENPYNLMLEMI